ncbi:hypothetical protein PV409_36420 [Streptomyces sp. ME02-6979.5a]|uniref:hypothetical protein n=1 Tax=Streptomyces sp. ME02-6979.5a TaxID=462925 RepID=UPI0029B7F0EE|nr:hypothetical protein [Streptomyces sp. ME02-6979.5a]MDX3343447.1 hypothetical protein [Streptomyces sp. ME02-6979.5a]
MTTTISTADTALAKARLIRDWHDSGAGRHAALADWVQSTTPDGHLMVSARLDGPLCAGMWAVFAARQEVVISLRSGAGDVLPALDYSHPDRTGCVWRQDGVWVEVWHPNTPEVAAPRPGPPTAVVVPPRPVPAPPPRPPAVTPSGRLPRRPANRFRRTPKEQ